MEPPSRFVRFFFYILVSDVDDVVVGFQVTKSGSFVEDVVYGQCVYDSAKLTLFI